MNHRDEFQHKILPLESFKKLKSRAKKSMNLFAHAISPITLYAFIFIACTIILTFMEVHFIDSHQAEVPEFFLSFRGNKSGKRHKKAKWRNLFFLYFFSLITSTIEGSNSNGDFDFAIIRWIWRHFCWCSPFLELKFNQFLLPSLQRTLHFFSRIFFTFNFEAFLIGFLLWFQ